MSTPLPMTVVAAPQATISRDCCSLHQQQRDGDNVLSAGLWLNDIMDVHGYDAFVGRTSAMIVESHGRIASAARKGGMDRAIGRGRWLS